MSDHQAQETGLQGHLYFRELEKLISLRKSNDEKLTLSAVLVEHICDSAVKEFKINFHTTFALVAFTGHTFSLPANLLYHLHAIRIQLKRLNDHSRDEIDLLYKRSIISIAVLIKQCWNIEIPEQLITRLPSPRLLRWQSKSDKTFYGFLSAIVVQVDAENNLLYVIADAFPGRSLKADLSTGHTVASFRNQLAASFPNFPLPISIELIDVQMDAEDILYPKAFVLQPNYLIDISLIASCFGQSEINYAGAFARKINSFKTSIPILLGNLSNYFLDELIAEPHAEFIALFKQAFQMNAEQFLILSDVELRDLMRHAKLHFKHLQSVVNDGLRRIHVDRENTYLEPSFFSAEYGLQGRLDLFHITPAQAHIIELKSGKPYRPNTYGLSQSHYIQTLLYDLLIKRAYGREITTNNFILYSVKPIENLCFAPVIKGLQYEALAVRNKLLSIEYKIANLDQLTENIPIFLKLIHSLKQNASKFHRDELQQFELHFNRLNSLEQSFVVYMFAFIAREQQLSKVGKKSNSNRAGQSGLWLLDVNRKVEQFDIFNDLLIIKNNTKDSEPLLVFGRSEKTAELANFRKGDLAICYPADEKSALEHQLIRGTIVELDKDQITVRLRARQLNHAVFVNNKYWHIEHDSLDSSFSQLYNGIAQFVLSHSDHRATYLGLQPPDRSVNNIELTEGWSLSIEQRRILIKMLSSPSYFLLWGPPGTGKTSIMLRYAIQYLFEHTNERILLLAYTNRAVDQICGAINSISNHVLNNSVRIGSKYSTHPDYTDILLKNIIKQFTSRHDIIDYLQNKRIYVATVASYLGKKNTLPFIQFDRVIIDEASQLLEPLLASLMIAFPRTVLIGDHLQLSAVVQQRKDYREVKDSIFHDIHLRDLGSSGFERLYRSCVANNWDWAFDILTMQGRMHADIMEFSSKHIYAGKLTVLSKEIDPTSWQNQPLDWGLSNDESLPKELNNRRVLFYNVMADTLMSSKTNKPEAERICLLVRLFRKTGILKNHSLGIITPFRAQIALIRKLLEDYKLFTDDISIDTVERYQGSARDIILISTAVQHENQLSSILSMSEEGIDRKLNVAITRARKQLIMLGNGNVLRKVPLYKQFVERYMVRN